MNCYQEVTIIRTPEIAPYCIWTKFYTQLHLALVEHAKATYGENTTQSDIGVSFPEYKCFEKNGETITILGSKLRVFAKTKAELEQLNLYKWCERLLDYVHIKNIAEVGQVSQYLVVQRYRAKSLEKQAKSFAAHKGIDMAQALTHCVKYKKAAKDYPFIRLVSQTNGQTYKLAICQTIVEQPVAGVFNRYGLNSISGAVTVPYWD